MSFEIANQLIDSYRQSNTQRISSAMESAYQEAMAQYKSESAARDAALDVLKTEQKLFADYQKEMNKARTVQRQGNFQLAQAAASAAHRNAIKKQQAKDRKQLLEMQRAGIMLGEERNAIVHSKDVSEVPISNAVSTGIMEVINTVNNQGGSISSGVLRNDLDAFLTPSLLQEQTSIETSNRRKVGLTKKGQKKNGTVKYKKAHLALSLIDLFKNETGKDDNDPLVKEFKDYLYKSSTGPAQSGFFKDAKNITQNELDKFAEDEKKAYLSKVKRSLPRTATTSSRISVPDTFEVSPLAREYRKLAEPVFQQLRESDVDSPFRLTEEEIATLNKESPQALDAYIALKEYVIDNPLAVELSEQLLLDDLALQRQLNMYNQKKRVQELQPRLQGIEEIKGRASEILQPKQKVSRNQYTPAQQKFFATEREAMKLSYKSDDDIRKMGKPEELGLMKFKQTFDPTTNSFLEGYSFDSVVADLEDKFQKSPGDAFRALSSFSSRVMSLQNARAPVIFPDGQRNQQYLQQLKKFKAE